MKIISFRLGRVEKAPREGRFRRAKRALGGVAGALIVSAVIFSIVCSPKLVGAAASTRRLPIYCVRRDEPVCSISFDAAWGNEDTQQLIDILARYGVKANFFLVGDWAERYPESVKALSDAGHEIGNHSSSHAHFTKLSAEEIKADVSACSDKIEAITGTRPTLFRAPYGEYDDRVVASVEELGMKVIQWDVDSLDWKELSAPEITERVVSRVKKGSIVLFHNAALHTPEALPGIIEKLISEGYKIVPISELLLDGDCTIDHEGRQCPAA